jgi:uncharacterized membrane protein YgcG
MSDQVSFEWSIPPSVMAKKTGDYAQRLIRAVRDLANYFAARIEAYAKTNAIWTDRTTHARQGLTATVTGVATAISIILFHKAEYGIWLEVANAGRYAIIMKSLEAHYPEIMSSLKALVS